MPNLRDAHNELFRRSPDECFSSLPDLMQHCQAQKEAPLDRWHLPQVLTPKANGRLTLQANSGGAFQMNDWSFTQLCGLAGVSKETVNRLSPRVTTDVYAAQCPQQGRSCLFPQVPKLWWNQVVRQ